MLNIVLLIVCICITIAAFVYFFYFNRLVAWFLGLAIRVVYWNNGASSIWLEIGSIHFSLLSGRILLKDVRYHSSNQTAKIVKAQIAWRYWIRRPTDEEEIGLSLGTDHGRSPRDSSCRIQVSVQGFEWLLYNRTAAYDNILAQMRSEPPERRASMQKSSGPSTPVPTGSLLTRSRAPAFLINFVTWIREQLPNLDPKDLLPLGIEVSTGSIICGNASTPNLLVAEFKRVEGTFGIVPSRSKYDLYKQMLTLRFKQALVQYVENEHYRDPMTSTGEVIEDEIQKQAYEPKTSSPRASYATFAKIWDSLKLYSSVLKYLTAYPVNARHAFPHRRKGRRAKKSLDEDTPIGVDFSKVEYAIERKILETPLLELCYYTDVVGLVPRHPAVRDFAALDSFDIGNGDVGPEWGVDILVHDGCLRYGPWADRQRGELQRTFFPPVYSDAQEAQRLEPGDQRVWTAMRVFVELRGETTLHIPLRENSKNWQWDGLTEGVERPRKREPALLHLTAGDRSSISYLMPMVASQRGYEPILEVHLDTVAVTSSLNDIRLVSAESCRVHCELPSPLKWNAERTWIVGVTLRRPTLFLIRDHINMFTDLGKDWSSGPPHDYKRFIPMIYQFELDMHHYELNLYANDHNIIDKPLIEEENALFTFMGIRLRFNTTIPSNVYRPESTTVPFAIDMPDASLKLSLPRWNTNALHAPKEGNTLARLGPSRIDGSYLYFSEVHEEHIEQLALAIKVRGVVFKSLGWSIRYFMILRENYLGSFTHFSTLYEYLDKRRRGAHLGDPVVQKYRPGTTNMMQVELGIVVLDGLMILPAGLPGYETGLDIPDAQEKHADIGHCLVLTMPELDLQLRLHDLYMEMTLNIGTISGSIEEHYPESLTYTNFKSSKSRDILVMDGIDIVANRLFGPVPRTITYVCLWELHFGSIKACLSAPQAAVLQAAGQSFGINFTDPLNAPADDYLTGVYPDLTFVKLTLSSVNVLWKAGGAALHVSVPQGLKLDHNDLGGQYHKKLTSIRLPYLSVKTLLDYNNSNMWLETAEITTDALLDIYSSPPGWHEANATQAEFVWEQDGPTGRVERFIQMLKSARSMPGTRSHLKGVYMPQAILFPHKVYSRHHHGSHRWHGVAPNNETIQSSESEGESAIGTVRGIRPLSHNPKDKADEESLSGDESDNEDLTERSESEWSDLDSEHSSDSTLKQYVHFMRHYVLYGDSPSLWEQDPFIPIRDSRFAYTLRNSKEAGLERTPIAFGSPDNSKVTTVYRLSQSKGLEVKITPLVITVLEKLQSDLEARHFIAEYWVDRWLSSCITDFPNPSKPQAPRCTILDVCLKSVTLQVIQRLDITVQTGPKGAEIGRFACLSSFVSNLSFTGQLSGEYRSLIIQLDKANVDLAVIPPDGHGHVLVNQAFAFSGTNLRAAFFRDDYELSCAKITSTVSYAFPASIISVIAAAECEVPRLVQIHKKMKTSSSDLVQSTIYHILHRSGDDPVIDPLSTIQPSFLVQIGLPHALRAAPRFRFLFHLRDCLWRLREIYPSWDNDMVQGIEVDELVPLLSERLLAVDPDAYHVSRLGPLESLIPNVKRSWSLDNYTKFPFSYASLKLGRVDLKISDPEGRPPCQISFVDVSPDLARGASVSVTLGDVDITIYSYLMAFVQQCLRAQKQAPPSSPVKKDKRARFNPFNVVHVHSVLLLNRLRLRAMAEKLTFEFGISRMRHSSVVLAHLHSKQQAMNHSLTFSEIFVKALATPEVAQPNEHDDLASFTITDSMVSTVMRNDNSEQKIKLAFTVRALRFAVPRSALRLYHFVEEWRADFLPGIETTLHAFMTEIDKPSSKVSRSPIFLKSLTVEVDGQVSSAGIYLRVMHDTWLSWEVNDVNIFLNSLGQARQASNDFGVKLESQTIAVSSDLAPASKPQINLEFPSFLLSGRFDKSSVRITSLVHFLELKVKPSHLDTLLAVQQKFGQDFNDFLVVIQQTRSRKAPAYPSSPISPPNAVPAPRLEFSMFAKMDGFRVGFEGQSSVLYLECPGIGAKFGGVPEKVWSITVTDLALSLAPRSSMISQSFGFNRHQRSAFVIIDFKVLSKSQGSKDEVLEVAVTKIHAVLQPSSIGEMGDFIDELQLEMTDRQEQRAHDLAAFKQKTQRIIQSFEVKNREPVSSETMSWLNHYIIQFSFSNIGVAFPLAHDHDMELPPAGSRDSAAVRAFLFSIQSIKFGTQHGETGQASMERLSFQFVPSFKQSVPADFLGDSHDTRNRLVYPTMKAQLRSSKSESSNQIYITATVSGFTLDVDSTIPEYVFSLFDVYRHGKERVQKLSANLVGPSSVEGAPLPSKQKSHPGSSTAAPDIFASLTFLSGKVCIYSTTASKSSRIRAYSGAWDRPELSLDDVGAEVFNLPVVSVWAEYRPTPPSKQLSEVEMEPSILIFKSTVHSSHNTLRPMLLSFLTEVVTLVETRLRTSPQIDPPSQAVSLTIQPEPVVPSPPPALRISFSLRIDQSRLELTCLPDVNVVVALHWDSGGFMINVLPGARDVTFTGTVGGLTIGLKHGFLSEDCLKLDARNLAFSVTLGNRYIESGPTLTSISLVVDTELRGAVRFSRLQDILCFKAVWLDRIPVFNGHGVNMEDSPTKVLTLTNVNAPNAPEPEFVTAVLIRIRQIKLDIDLGQSISSVVLHLENSILSSKFTPSFNDLSFRVGHVSITAQGNVAGHADVSNCVFQTIRWVGNPKDSTRDRMLELRMTSGPLIVMLESDYQKLLHYRAEPLAIEILDDWSLQKSNENDRPLRLSVTVKSPEVVAVATVGTIPKLLAYANKFKANLEVQREGASRESNTFRISRAPKPDNPLSAVAEAMITSARTRFKEADAVSYTVRQHMSLRLDLLRIVVFPRMMEDVEVAQFVGRDVRGTLNRLVESASISSKRDIRFSFSSMKISRFTQLGHATMPPSTEISDGKQWLELLLKDASSADIVGLPSMIMHMTSEESKEGPQKKLAYDFDSRFVRVKGVQHSEDIYISLNVGLYSWLTVLRKTLAREMEQVRATADWRTFTLSPVQPRKKVPEPLNLTDPPRSATIPHPPSSSTPFSPISPKSPVSAVLSPSFLSPDTYSKFQLTEATPISPNEAAETKALIYQPGHRNIERLTMRQLGEATPDVMHPFFMKKAGFSLEDSLPQYVHEYATAPLEEIMEILLKLYNRQLLADTAWKE
ncbi:hypothetical protein BDP27DRAFT_1401949 [Rhodocollybia butyracea]|uniref:Csf1 N-terminal domain-containing protein n=1 Tax=Rhodocollybia butyracea TaxID=206335 RepID=A0A9P5U969_9AGAR|nr:hypothetical protein BDP27DRAFT_1401949 [Rhodocollybia butyracea]